MRLHLHWWGVILATKLEAGLFGYYLPQAHGNPRIQYKPAVGGECAGTGAVPNKFTFQWRLKNQRVHLPGLAYLFRFDDRIIKLHTKGRARGQLRIGRNELHALHFLEISSGLWNGIFARQCGRLLQHRIRPYANGRNNRRA